MFQHAPVAQLDRVPGYELGGRRFESFRARQFSALFFSHLALTTLLFVPHLLHHCRKIAGICLTLSYLMFQ